MWAPTRATHPPSTAGDRAALGPNPRHAPDIPAAAPPLADSSAHGATTDLGLTPQSPLPQPIAARPQATAASSSTNGRACLNQQLGLPEPTAGPAGTNGWVCLNQPQARRAVNDPGGIRAPTPHRWRLPSGSPAPPPCAGGTNASTAHSSERGGAPTAPGHRVLGRGGLQAATRGSPRVRGTREQGPRSERAAAAATWRSRRSDRTHGPGPAGPMRSGEERVRVSESRRRAEGSSPPVRGRSRAASRSSPT